jgi:type I site-specific restriction endonuclease
MPTEAQARLAINRSLEEAGWLLLPGAAGEPANVVCEHRIRTGGDTGFADYLLPGDDGKAVAVPEAKRPGSIRSRRRSRCAGARRDRASRRCC